MPDRWTRLALAAISAFLLVLTLTPGKPGLPSGLKADEAAYYLMASSLGHDFDLRVESDDTTRLFEEFHFRPTRNLIVMSDDGWQSVYYGKPYLYPLLGAPFVLLFGANGLVFLNALLFLAMVWLGTAYLSRVAPPPLAALFSAGFFFVSAIFPYVFWLHPEIFTAFCVTLALFFGFGRDEATSGAGRYAALQWGLSGAALALAAYHKPMYAALALALVGPPLLRRRVAPVVSWSLGFLLALGASCAGSLLLTGEPSAYLAGERMGVTVCAPGEAPLEVQVIEAAGEPQLDTPEEATPAVETPLAPHRSWAWILRPPPVSFGEVVEATGYFLWGRHAGLLPYFPFAAIGIVLFLVWGRGSRERWLLAASLAVVAFYFLLFLDWNWQGGGGFVGNRYYLAVVPGFLFLVPRLKPSAVLLGFVVGGLFVGALVLSPFGVTVPEPTLQAHTRNAPLRLLPLELSLRNVPGYTRIPLGGVSVIARRDQVLVEGDLLRLRGASQVELLLLSPTPLGRSVFQIASPVAANEITARLAGQTHRLEAERPGQGFRLEVEPRASRVRSVRGRDQWVYKLLVSSERGEPRTWTRPFPPQRCTNFPSNDSFDESFFVGADFLYLGPAETVEADVYGVEWRAVEAPPVMSAGREQRIAVELVNTSGSSWQRLGAARVNLSYHWRDEDGNLLVRDGVRTELPLPLEPGAAARVEQRIRTPEAPGVRELELDLVLENVGWFSENGAAPYRIPVVVEPPAGGPTTREE